jgi:hypothetical protein
MSGSQFYGTSTFLNNISIYFDAATGAAAVSLAAAAAAFGVGAAASVLFGGWPAPGRRR